MKNDQIPICWANNTPAKNHNGTFSTDGLNLYSYQKIIGVTEGNQKILYEYNSKTNNFISQTTSTHVRLAASHANLLLIPD